MYGQQHGIAGIASSSVFSLYSSPQTEGTIKRRTLARALWAVIVSLISPRSTGRVMQGDLVVEILIGVLLLTGLASWINLFLSLSWNRSYFTSGWSFLSLSAPVGSFHTNTPSVSVLEAQFRSPWIGNLLFRQVAPDTYAVRGRVFDFSLTNLGKVQGTLSFDRTNRRVMFRAFLHWWDLPILLTGGLILAAALAPWASRMWLQGLLQLAAFSLLIGPPILVGRRRCRMLVQFAARAWERVYSPSDPRHET